MYTQKIFVIFILLIITIVADREKKKFCVRNLVIGRINLLATHRKQLLVIGITNFNNQSSRTQAHKFNDLYRDLERNNIRDSIVRLILINEQQAADAFINEFYGKIQVFQDNSKDRAIEKLSRYGPTSDTFVFGRCGYLIFSQDHQHSNLDEGKNYQELFNTLTKAVKHKRICQHFCI